MTSHQENSGSFKQLRHDGEIRELVGTKPRNIHTFCVQSYFQKFQSLWKRRFTIADRFAKWGGFVAFAEITFNAFQTEGGITLIHGTKGTSEVTEPFDFRVGRQVVGNWSCDRRLQWKNTPTHFISSPPPPQKKKRCWSLSNCLTLPQNIFIVQPPTLSQEKTGESIQSYPNLPFFCLHELDAHSKFYLRFFRYTYTVGSNLNNTPVPNQSASFLSTIKNLT